MSGGKRNNPGPGIMQRNRNNGEGCSAISLLPLSYSAAVCRRS